MPGIHPENVRRLRRIDTVAGRRLDTSQVRVEGGGDLRDVGRGRNAENWWWEADAEWLAESEISAGSDSPGFVGCLSGLSGSSGPWMDTAPRNEWRQGPGSGSREPNSLARGGNGTGSAKDSQGDLSRGRWEGQRCWVRWTSRGRGISVCEGSPLPKVGCPSRTAEEALPLCPPEPWKGVASLFCLQASVSVVSDGNRRSLRRKSQDVGFSSTRTLSFGTSRRNPSIVRPLAGARLVFATEDRLPESRGRGSARRHPQKAQ